MLQYKKMIICTASTIGVLLLFVFLLINYLSPVSDQPSEEVYGLTDYEIDAYGRNTILTKSALKKMLENCRTVPEIGESPRFQYLLNLPGESVTLTPRDSLMLFLYDGKEETVAYTKEQYAGKILKIKFEADDDSYFFAVTTESAPPTEAGIAEDYRED